MESTVRHYPNTYLCLFSEQCSLTGDTETYWTVAKPNNTGTFKEEDLRNGHLWATTHTKYGQLDSNVEVLTHTQFTWAQVFWPIHMGPSVVCTHYIRSLFVNCHQVQKSVLKILDNHTANENIAVKAAFLRQHVQFLVFLQFLQCGVWGAVKHSVLCVKRCLC